MFLIYDRILEKGVIGYTFLPIYRERREDKKLQMVNSWLALLTDMGRAVKEISKKKENEMADII